MYYELSRNNPFHNLKRLGVKNFKGGDCFVLASKVKESFGGSIITLRYKNCGDWHWVNKKGNHYIDLTSKNIIYEKEYLDKICYKEGSIEDYYKPRESSLDATFLLRQWTSPTTFLSIAGLTLKINGTPTAATEKEVKALIKIYTGITDEDIKKINEQLHSPIPKHIH